MSFVCSVHGGREWVSPPIIDTPFSASAIMDELAANKEHEIYPCGIILPLNSTVQQVKRTKQSNQMEDASLNKNENKKKKKNRKN